MDEVTVIGGGLAGSEAAWQLAARGIKVKLYEMRPQRQTPAHHTGYLAELVCSNSLRSDDLENAAGLLKEELRKLGSLVIGCADRNRVPAGSALAVDRQGFAEQVTRMIEENSNISVVREEVTAIKEGRVIIATGPLTSDALSDAIKEKVGTDYLYFYDAAAPIVTSESIDYDKVFRASRYGKGGDHYINCPFTEEEYDNFVYELVNAETHPVKEFETLKVFEGCMPIEVMARRGRDTLLYGPLKPVGLSDPRTGKPPYAVVQLRQDNLEGTLYNLVGFQTNLKWGEQKRVFGKIPGLEQAEFVRFGVMHRNTFINSPRVLLPTQQMKQDPNIMFAGQITGVEGYIESTASGLAAGINMARIVKDEKPVIFPLETAIGSLLGYISRNDSGSFQPMNINFGLLPPLKERIRNKRERNRMLSERSLKEINQLTNI
ncbi:MAG: Methylenetetrahydrofolate--tRNA-(uracil-5-)-methyltransferase TrmFO [Firmicutes bacterium]|nr:Methylenetetrahydrofolate--tRNA-(uracil-5-)-methyltransferase TrmFO [Bacillota bacterium]